MLDQVMRDGRFAFRQMARVPALTAVATFVMALGIGTNTAVLAVIDGVLFRPPPGVHGSDALVTASSMPVVPPPSGVFNDRLTYGEFLAIRDQRGVLAEAAAWIESGVALRTAQGDERVSAELVTSAYFRVLQAPMALGSTFRSADDRILEVVLGYGFWNERLGGSAAVIGQALTFNGQTFTVIGVASRGFAGADGDDDPIDVWLPATAYPLLFPTGPNLLDGARRFSAVARRAGGASLSQSRAAAAAVSLRTPSGIVERDGLRRLSVSPYRGLGMHDAGEILAIVGGAGGLIGTLVLLIACVNVSALLLGRSLVRRREIAVRLALGAGRSTILRQLLTESILLGLIAGAFGVLLAVWALHVLGARLFTFPVQLSARPATLVASIAVAAGTGVVFGLFPALDATRAAVFTTLKDAVAGADPRTSRLRGWFAVAQLALCLPLLTAAGLLVSGVIRSARADDLVPEPARIALITLDLSRARYSANQTDALLTEARMRVAALPGVVSAAFSRIGPLSSDFTGRIRPPHTDASAGPFQIASLNAVDPEFFAVLGVGVVRGRMIDRSDVVGGSPAVVIGEDVARRLWPDEDPIGKTLTYIHGLDNESILTIVGVTRDIAPEPGGSLETIPLYGSRLQFPDTLTSTLVVRTSGGAATTIVEARRILNALDPRLIVYASTTLAERMRLERIELARASAGASGVGLVALLLACIGVYAVVAFGVAERTREIGVRIALGATRAAIVRLFVRDGVRIAVISIAIGFPLSFAAVRLLGAGMVGVERFTIMHGAALAAIALLLLTVATLSSWVPARRSAAVDPVVSLRAE